MCFDVSNTATHYSETMKLMTIFKEIVLVSLPSSGSLGAFPSTANASG